ncbi:hypothetical protein XA68_17015 [Ophiocordyceps unilateralis]|uniref:Uncharacterized protein n=1 Tax=Ophiocordyceps unilateralis TaxID=268505 RepID=A0A2A9P474_OPHUN|nr:hypothetical protein XA68_17015 [Ophiocordyceps unilateralis]
MKAPPRLSPDYLCPAAERHLSTSLSLSAEIILSVPPELSSDFNSSRPSAMTPSLAARGITASLRSPRGSCLGRALPPHPSSLSPVACRCLTVHQPRRYASSDHPELPSPPTPPPRMTRLQFLVKLFRVSFQNLAVALSPRGIRSAYRDSPATMVMAISILAGLGLFSYWGFNFIIQTFYREEICRYPDPIANSLRRALYYSIIHPDNELALRYYKKAMEQCVEIGFEPFSDEVLGIRIQVAGWLEKIDRHKTAAHVLETVLTDCMKWIAAMEQCVKDDKVDDAGRYRPADDEMADEMAHDMAHDMADEKTETLWRKRQRLLRKAVGTSLKLGELYADEHVLEPDKAHAKLVWAVETSLREFQRRQRQGPKPGEQDWLKTEELGASLESLGRDYTQRGQSQLAIPLLFRALRMCESACQRAVIMNNLAVAFAQQPLFAPEGPVKTSDDASDGPLDTTKTPDSLMIMTRRESLEAALNWAQNAHRHAVDVQGDDRTPSCDQACAAALCTWADVAATQGKVELARAKYGECMEMSRDIGFLPGFKHASKGIAQLDGQVKRGLARS